MNTPPIPLLKPPPRIDKTTIFIVVIFSILTGIQFYRGNMLGAYINLSVVILNVVLGYWRYISMNRLHKRFQRLKIMQEIISTPTMQEVGNSVLFTFVSPSPELMEEITKDSPKNKEGK